MKMMFKAAALAALTLSASTVAISTPAMAQSKSGVATADVRTVMARSNAFTTAMQQIETTYKAQIDARDARAQTLQAEVNVLIAKYNEEARRTPQNTTALQAAGKALQDKRNSANAELGQLSAQTDLAVAYVEDQISVRMSEAIKAGMTKRKVDLLLSPDAVLARENNVDISDAITAELNTLLPSVQIVPPAGYQPGSLVEARNRQMIDAARAAQGQPAQTPPATQPSSR